MDKHAIVKAVKELSMKIGSEKVLVRYDPILINHKYTLSYHERAFEKLCKELQGYVAAIVISFVDDYKNLRSHQMELNMETMNEPLMMEIAKRLGPIAKRYQIPVQTCAENIDLRTYGISNTPCFERQHLSSIFHRPILTSQNGVRKNCACLATVDIGDYNCCSHHCKYCYANYDESLIQKRMRQHDPQSSVLIGNIQDNDVITIRKEKKLYQETLF